MNYLLTGAGFTKSFGGYLASEMWSKVFNEIDEGKYPELKETALEYAETVDFEGLYNEVISGEYSAKEQGVINDAVVSAYDSLDGTIRSWNGNPDEQHPLSESKLSSFLGQFTHWFTTNQDIFVERHIKNVNFFAPGVGDNTTFRGELRRTGEKKGLVLPNDISEITFRTERGYYKLHGSCNWRGTSNGNVMIIGSNKDEQIAENPITRKYLEDFESALMSAGNQLLVIGYGFKDSHIDEIILKAISDFNLKLYVMQPFPIAVIENDDIRRSLAGYFEHSLNDAFPHSGGLQYRNDLKGRMNLDSYPPG